MQYPIYLDNNATTKIDPRVLEEMMPFLKDDYGNASSNHEFGVNANKAVKRARNQIADLIHCDSHEIIFTSGATEAINLAIKGVLEKHTEKGKHIVTVSTEHPAVIDCCKYLESKGFEVTYLPVNNDGLLDLDLVKENIRADTILVAVMLVNNETGVIQPIKEIAELAHEKGAFFMTDATQVLGKMHVDVNEMGIDLMAFSGHKFYGPKGVGALYVRNKRPSPTILEALIHGGGHERGMRSGTMNVPGIVGLGKAAEIAKTEMKADEERIGALRTQLENVLLELDDTFVNGNRAQRLYNVSNICFKGVDAEDLILQTRMKMAVSTGSACSSAAIEPSHVLISMGLSNELAYSSIRFSLGKFNTINELTEVEKIVKEVVNNIRKLHEI
ncbi:MAG: cysteine desulfurase family protein [Chitinophagales bacterium]